ncbi:lytic transglycosylase domain-containing protein [Phenylobacterium sp.]|uniref:lytic transglycosylase domain-containing protein n=1 Tax=Phenylobacterium sp. TaxID=1871053 RepID=UPI0011F4DA91|nr:lytic transglycosylase domain-containing protein [Phenylobacterium sp.]THD60942.1 MAG: conjugal transfer protein [Phenylobacterium sp.]
MPLDPSTVLALAASCAAHVAPDTMLAVSRVESGLDPLVIGVNGARPQRISSTSAAAAVVTAERLIATGRNIDLGLAQINVRNLAPLGLSVADAFDPCRNLAASARLLRAGWTRAAAGPVDPIAAMTATLSLYNTGTIGRGVSNGYVAKVVAAAGQTEPRRPPPPPPPARPAWQVFAAAPAPGRFVLAPIPGAVQ